MYLSKPYLVNKGNLLIHNGEVIVVAGEDGNKVGFYKNNELIYATFEEFEMVPLTEENLLKFIDWDFSEGLDIKRSKDTYWKAVEYCMHNIVDGTSDFSIVFAYSEQVEDLHEVKYFVDKDEVFLGLFDAVHNLQNLFLLCAGEVLPVKVR